MTYLEYVGNLHLHTCASDGTIGHEALAHLADEVGLDFIIVTDHNVHAGEHQGWHGRVLLIVGEEVHNPADPNANHYLVLGTGQTMAAYADDPQRLIEAVRTQGGLGFIAHPVERSGAFADEPEIDWKAWDATGYTGLEIWNYMSEFKSHLPDLLRSVLYAFCPKLAITGPYAETLARWDALLAEREVWGIGGTDAHGTRYRLGPFSRQVFSYRHLLRSLNTHILVPTPWRHEAAHDVRLVYEALARGKCFIAYDGLAPATGFTFTARHGEACYTMGDAFLATGKVYLETWTPARAHLRLIHNGFCVASVSSPPGRGSALAGTRLVYATDAPGAYRIEAYRPYALKQRAWIVSNPIIVRTARRAPSTA